jgi:hypothetical protein
VILSADPTAVDPETLADLQVLVTVKDDKVIYEAATGAVASHRRYSPFSSDPVVAQGFMHAIYASMYFK